MRTTSTASSSSREPSEQPKRLGRAGTLELLRALGVRPDRRSGQSFLIDPFVADAEVALLDLRKGEPLIEIGGGLGILTEAILRRGLGPLTVVERDPRLARHLAETFAGRARIVRGDALSIPIPPVRAAIGNLPYSTATAILERLLSEGVPRIVAMLQREVAQRFAARPGTRAYGRLTIRTAARARVELFRTAGPEAFVPPPEVESQIAAFSGLPSPPLGVPLEALEAAIDPLFASRRKQLANLLPRLGPDATRGAEEAGWPTDWPKRRPEELAPEAYFRFAEALTRLRAIPPGGPKDPPDRPRRRQPTEARTTAIST